VAAENAFDADAVLATMQPEPDYDVRAYDVVVHGRAACHEFLTGHFQSMPGIVSEAVRFYHADEAVVAEIHVEGTHDGELAGIPAKGNGIDVDSMAVFFFEPDGDVILGEQIWADMLVLTAQLSGDHVPESRSDR
jgi:steroid delta-isomerase-like uncharacterized protein